MTDDDLGTVRWFGDSWGAPINDPRAWVSTPADRQCIVCHRWIRTDDQGVTTPYYHDGIHDTAVYHLDCFLGELGISISAPLVIEVDDE